MGSSSSKPATSPSPHVWKGSGPPSASHNMVEQLQSSSETDASRSQTLELQIQARVAEELRRLQAKEAARLKEAQEKLSEPAENEQEGAVSSQSVSKEVEALRTKLEGRKKIRQLPETVETARSEVIRCLRENDRRPLDCWREVERFKDEVRRLGVERVIS